MSENIYHIPCLIYALSAFLVQLHQGKGTAVPVRIMVAFNGSGCSAPLLLNLITKQEWSNLRPGRSTPEE
jgi:hypothetical protein